MITAKDVEEPEDYNNMVPLFSLERLQSGYYCLSSLEKDDKAAFFDHDFTVYEHGGYKCI